MTTTQETSRNSTSPGILILPSLLGEHDAAKYLGISKSTLRTLGISRRKLGGRRLYDRRDLETYVDSLPYENEDNGRANTCDEVFG